MSKKLFSFMIGELKTIRIVCKDKHCGAISELSIEQLSGHQLKCPCCRAVYNDDQERDPLEKLCQAIYELNRSKLMGIEFVLPVKE